MSLADELRAAARAGDVDRVVELVEAATEKERRAAAKGMGERDEHGFWMPRSEPAWALAWLGTHTAREVTGWAFVVAEAPLDPVLRVLTARGRQFLDTLVRAFERERFRDWRLIRAAVREGLIERPEARVYTSALVTGVGSRSRWFEEDAVYQGLLGDEGLLDEDVWRIFDEDVTLELAAAHVYDARAPGPGIRKAVGNRWTYALVRLAAEGRLDRQRLLDASLAALQRDFRASTVGWHAKLHEALEPTAEERVARLDTYLALLASPVPAVAKEGLTGLKAIEERVPGEELARAAAPALTQRQKGLPVDVLRLVGRAVAREPEAAPALLATAAEALGHENADVQERALALLEAHELDDRARAVVLGLAETVSPTLRPRVEALTGLALEAGPADPTVEEARPPLTPATAQSARAPVEPVGAVDDLIELAAALLEGQGSGDDAERFLDGVSRLCAFRDDGFERRTGALAKRARAAAGGRRDLTGTSGVEVVARVVLAWTQDERPPSRTPLTLLGFLGLRAAEVASRARIGKARGLLALPTHAGGWIDPDVLAARLAERGRFLNRPDPLDREAASVRAGAFGPIRLEPSVSMRKALWFSGPEPTVSLRVAELPPEADHFRARLASDAPQWSWDPWSASDALGVRWLLTVLPGDPEPAYGHALRYAVVQRDKEAAYGHPELVLEHALDPYVPITELGWKAVAAGLLGRPQEVKRAAVDVVVAAISDGRFDADGVGAGLAWLVANDLAKVSRLEQPVRDAGRVSPLHAAEVARAVVSFAAACKTTPPGLGGPLTAANELAAATGVRADGPAGRAALERIASEVSASSKLGRAARGLLGPRAR